MNKEKYWDRVALYGTFDGFTYSTDDLPKMVVILDDGERVEIPDGCVISADQIVEKDKIKLKDVIRRINRLDEDSKTYWLDTILNWFSLDFGLTKYKQGYDQGKLEGEWVGQQLKDADKIRQELNQPVVPQFVADWYEENKDDFENALFRSIDLMPSTYEEGEFSEFEKWLADEHTKPFQILVNVHQFGYTVEKEKRYTVKVKAVLGQYLGRYYINNEILTPQFTRTQYTGDEGFPTFTRSELEQAGFGWVFDCPGVEVREVEE